jgi:hypothetical protein
MVLAVLVVENFQCAISPERIMPFDNFWKYEGNLVQKEGIRHYG